MALTAARARAVALACAVALAATACDKSPGVAGAKNPVAANAIGDGDRGIATYSVAGSSRARGVVTYRLVNPRTHVAAFELLLADSSGPAFRSAIAAGKHRVAIARDGVVLHAIGTAGAQEERAFLKAMRSPAPKRPLRASATFTSALIDDNESGDATNGIPARLYKLFGMFHDGDDVELYLAIALDGSAVTFSEKDSEYRASLTTFLSS